MNKSDVIPEDKVEAFTRSIIQSLTDGLRNFRPFRSMTAEVLFDLAYDMQRLALNIEEIAKEKDREEGN